MAAKQTRVQLFSRSNSMERIVSGPPRLFIRPMVAENRRQSALHFRNFQPFVRRVGLDLVFADATESEQVRLRLAP